MSELPPTTVPDTEFRQLLLQGAAFIDVRAEIEYQKGSLPGASNLPILTTDERQQVGTVYKQQGSDSAVALGHQLVAGQTKTERVAAWCDYASSQRNCYVFCWRGGMRSNLAAQWMAEAGQPIPVIEGGYKALRRFLMAETEAIADSADVVVIGGRTGAAKTPLVQALASGIDLEHHAHHRGSSFGRHATPVPSQADFEHRLAIDLMRIREQQSTSPLFLEDESNRIGAVSIPASLFQRMREAPLAIVDMPLAFRIERIYQEYVVELQREYHALGHADAEQLFQQHLQDSLHRIRNRLGLQRYAELAALMQQALANASQPDHEAWIKRLLVDYYDPMYEYQMSKSVSRVEFRGNYDAVLEWCKKR